jgi:hypothetical protein
MIQCMSNCDLIVAGFEVMNYFFQKIKLNDLQIENLKRTMTHASLTDQEIGALPEGTKVSCVFLFASH